ncbi:uncharacterized protein LOC116618989 isoform X2 [Nematostella vectensis]|uniref:uncharacterized protein LOC116618989 isoform X2 n=1 Tax=Nematostella vectensis TaxID=45351 RepID=UPI0020777590|nr:uncharacterized protein LOC116618989 isoform X2 [Nematostella vectensis]
MRGKMFTYLVVAFLVVFFDEAVTKTLTDSDIEKDLANILNPDDTPETDRQGRSGEDDKLLEKLIEETPQSVSRDDKQRSNVFLTAEEKRQKIRRILKKLTEDAQDRFSDPLHHQRRISNLRGHFSDVPEILTESGPGSPPGYNVIKPGTPEGPSNDNPLNQDGLSSDEIYNNGAVYNVPDKIPAPPKPADDVPVFRKDESLLKEKREIYEWIKTLHKRGEHMPSAVARLIRDAIVARRQ